MAQRKFILAASAVVVLLAMAACGGAANTGQTTGSGAGGSPDLEPVVIEWSIGWAERRTGRRLRLYHSGVLGTQEARGSGEPAVYYQVRAPGQHQRHHCIRCRYRRRGGDGVARPGSGERPACRDSSHDYQIWQQDFRRIQPRASRRRWIRLNCHY